VSEDWGPSGDWLKVIWMFARIGFWAMVIATIFLGCQGQLFWGDPR
jgi:hypothetical protein